MRLIFKIGILLLVITTLFSCKKVEATNPSIVTETVTDIKAAKVTLNGTAISGSKLSIVEKGFCYLANAVPSYSNNTTAPTYELENKFEARIKGLKGNTNYYVNTYCKLSDGTLIYGEATYFRTNFNYETGDTGPAGGLIINRSASGTYSEIYLIPSITANWGCSGYEIGNLSVISGSANTNTSRIYQSCGSFGSAARVCYDYSINDYNDWYLPTVGELSSIAYAVKNGSYNFPADSYWSSSEYDASQAYSVDFTSGTWVKYSKLSNLKVVAIRYF